MKNYGSPHDIFCLYNKAAAYKASQTLSSKLKNIRRLLKTLVSEFSAPEILNVSTETFNKMVNHSS